MKQLLHPFPEWELSVSTNDAEGATLAPLEIAAREKSSERPGVIVVAYRVEPGLITVPEQVREICVFSSSFDEVASLLTLKGTWRAARHDCLLREVGDVPLETLKDGLFLRAKGTPLFSVRMERLDG